MLICTKCGKSYDPKTRDIQQEVVINFLNVSRCQTCVDLFLEHEGVEDLINEYIQMGENLRVQFLKYIDILKTSREISEEEEKRLYEREVNTVVQDEKKKLIRKLKQLSKEYDL